MNKMAKCKDCKYMDLTQRLRGGLCVCTNTNRTKYSKWGGCATVSEVKRPTSNACKTGFEPREDQYE